MYFQFSPHYVHIFAIGDHAQITVSTIFSGNDKLEFINLASRFVNFGSLYIWCTLVKQTITQTINNFFIQIGHNLYKVGRNCYTIVRIKQDYIGSSGLKSRRASIRIDSARFLFPFTVSPVAIHLVFLFPRESV